MARPDSGQTDVARACLVYAHGDSLEWESYARGVLEAECCLRLQFTSYRVDQLQPPFPVETARNVAQSLLQVVIISPDFLWFVDNNGVPLSNLVNPTKTLALLVGVTSADVIARHDNGFQTFSQWVKHVRDGQEEDFTGNFVLNANSILRESCSNKSNLDEEKFTLATGSHDGETVTTYILLSTPLASPDGELFIWLHVAADSEPIGPVRARRKNDTTFSFLLAAESYQELTGVEVHYRGMSWGLKPVWCPWTLETLGNFLKTHASPIDFLCQSLGITSCAREELDDALEKIFDANCSPGMELLRVHSEFVKTQHRDDTYPTLLHLAAAYGLERLCHRLVHAPGGEQALVITNQFGQQPVDLAHEGDHQPLVNSLLRIMVRPSPPAPD